MSTAETENDRILNEADTLGRVTWHTSEEGGGPDVGISLGLGDDRILWCGEISNKLHTEAADFLEVGEQMPANDGSWFVLFDGMKPATVLGKCLNAEDGREFIEAIGIIITKLENGKK